MARLRGDGQRSLLPWLLLVCHAPPSCSLSGCSYRVLRLAGLSRVRSCARVASGAAAVMRMRHPRGATPGRLARSHGSFSLSCIDLNVDSMQRNVHFSVIHIPYDIARHPGSHFMVMPCGRALPCGSTASAYVHEYSPDGRLRSWTAVSRQCRASFRQPSTAAACPHTIAASHRLAGRSASCTMRTR